MDFIEADPHMILRVRSAIIKHGKAAMNHLSGKIILKKKQVTSDGIVTVAMRD